FCCFDIELQFTREQLKCSLLGERDGAERRARKRLAVRAMTHHYIVRACFIRDKATVTPAINLHGSPPSHRGAFARVGQSAVLGLDCTSIFPPIKVFWHC